MSEEEGYYDPTEITLYREPYDDHFGTSQDRLYECGSAPWKGIGIAVGGTVYVKPLKAWHSLESDATALRAENARLRKALERIIKANNPDNENHGEMIDRMYCLAKEALSLGSTKAEKE